MKNTIYLLASLLLVTAACGAGSNPADPPELLFVQNSDGGTLTDSTLTLTGVSPQTGWFTDRPYRVAGQVPTERFVLLWDESSVVDDPPNADFTCTVEGEVVNYVVELQNPALLVPYVSEGCDSGICVLGYDITFIGTDVVEAGDFVECDGTAHLFIDAATDSAIAVDQSSL